MADKEPLIDKKGEAPDYSEGKEELSGSIVKPTEERDCTDCIFIFLFWGFFLGAFVCAMIAWDNFNSELVSTFEDCWSIHSSSVEQVSIMGVSSTMYNAQKDMLIIGGSIDLFCLVGIIALFLGFFWITIMSCCVAVIIYVAVYFIPIAMIFVGAGVAYIMGYEAGDTNWIIGGALISVAGIAGVFVVKCLFQESIEATIDLFENAGDFMEDSPMMFACSFGNIIFKFLMLIMFLGFIGLGIMTSTMTKPDYDDGDDATKEDGCNWEKSKYFDYYMWYQVIAMVWTVSLITNLNIGTVAGSAGLWYFGDEADRCNAKDNRTCTALKWCFTKSFGSLALGALVSTFIILLQTYLIYLRETMTDPEADDTFVTKAVKYLLRCVINCFLAILQCILRFITYFATIYLVVRGESFCQGAKKCFNLLKRNGLSAMVVDAFTSWFVFLTTQAVAILLGVITVYVLYTARGASDLGCGMGFLLAFIIGNIVFGIFTDIVMAVVDAMYVFVAIDEDSGRPSTHKSAEKMKAVTAKHKKE